LRCCVQSSAEWSEVGEPTRFTVVGPRRGWVCGKHPDHVVWMFGLNAEKHVTHLRLRLLLWCPLIMRSAVGKTHFGTPASHLRSIALLEGLSYLVLLFIAMPLKYLGDMPMAVRIVGSAHGALFVWLGLLALRGLTSRGRPASWAARIMVASLLPFGTLVIDRRLRGEVDAGRSHTERV